MAVINDDGRRFWRGAVLGPLAVFPALWLPLLVYALSAEGVSFDTALPSTIGLVGFVGIVLAYTVTLVYGGLVWALLRATGWLSMGSLTLCALLPGAVFGLWTQSAGAAGFVAYFSLATGFGVWAASGPGVWETPD
ncbi:MAG: hypothetical protein AAF460_14230 [Pseudomonadota bacterium]